MRLTLLDSLFGVVTVSAFSIPGAIVPKRRTIRHTNAKFRFPRDVSIDDSTTAGSDGVIAPLLEVHEQTAIMEGASPRAIKLRQQIQAIWNDQMNTAPIVLHGPRGSGKRELADEVVYHLPSWQTQHVHRLSLDDGLDYIDTILGTVDHPGLLDHSKQTRRL